MYGRALVESGSDASGRRLLLYGDLDLASARALDSELLAAMTAGGSPLMVDLSGLSEVDRPALRVLLRRQRAALAGGVRLLIRLTPGQAARLA